MLSMLIIRGIKFIWYKPTIRNNIITVNNPFNVGAAYTGGGSDTVKFYNNLIFSENEKSWFKLFNHSNYLFTIIY